MYKVKIEFNPREIEAYANVYLKGKLIYKTKYYGFESEKTIIELAKNNVDNYLEK